MYNELKLPVRYRHIRGRDVGDDVLLSDFREAVYGRRFKAWGYIICTTWLFAFNIDTSIEKKTAGSDDDTDKNNNKKQIEETVKKCPFSPNEKDSKYVDNGDFTSGGIQKNGGWFYTKAFILQHHAEFDPGFGNAINDFLHGQSIIDLGAGIGQLGVYLQNIQSDIKWYGFDGGNNIESFVGRHVPLITNKNNYIVPHMCFMDLSKKINFSKNDLVKDWAISVEVGEHIPKKYESIFFDNLSRASKKGVILTWALKGQGGAGHVNEQNNDYVIDKMEAKGFVYDKTLSMYFRSTATTLDWLYDTIMVFWKTDYYNGEKKKDDEKSTKNWKESSIHLTVGVEVMNDAHLSTTWEALFGAGEFFSPRSYY